MPAPELVPVPVPESESVTESESESESETVRTGYMGNRLDRIHR
jgi:hypothetical protein